MGERDFLTEKKKILHVCMQFQFYILKRVRHCSFKHVWLLYIATTYIQDPLIPVERAFLRKDVSETYPLLSPPRITLLPLFLSDFISGEKG